MAKTRSTCVVRYEGPRAGYYGTPIGQRRWNPRVHGHTRDVHETWGLQFVTTNLASAVRQPSPQLPPPGVDSVMIRRPLSQQPIPQAKPNASSLTQNQRVEAAVVVVAIVTALERGSSRRVDSLFRSSTALLVNTAGTSIAEGWHSGSWPLTSTRLPLLVLLQQLYQ